MLHSTPGALNRMAAANRLTLIVFPANRRGKTLFHFMWQKKKLTKTDVVATLLLCAGQTKKNVSRSIIQVGGLQGRSNGTEHVSGNRTLFKAM